MNVAENPMVLGGIGAPEILLILLVLVLLFGATKLPELARGSGRALRIFKAETKGLMDEDEEKEKEKDEYRAPERKQIEALGRTEPQRPESTVQEPHRDTDR